MVILGMLLIVVGALAILAAVFVSAGSAELLGMHMNALTIFLVGVAAGAFVLWGFTILKYGTKRELKARRDRKELGKLSQKLDQVEQDRKPEGNEG